MSRAHLAEGRRGRLGEADGDRRARGALRGGVNGQGVPRGHVSGELSAGDSETGATRQHPSELREQWNETYALPVQAPEDRVPLMTSQ